ncbi:MAG: septal ring lytic transglycosylase RlpA family protein, partial [Desulfotignum sp.]
MTGRRFSMAGVSWSASAVLLLALRDEPYSTRGNPDSYNVLGKRYSVLASNTGFRERGIASWYGNKFHGRPTSSGEPYDMYKMTAAHKSLRLPTYVRVTNLDNGK